jgi:hypothetical protein
MADLFYTGSTTSSLNLDTGATYGTIDTGDLRRKYNFGDRVSELAIAQDPFFRFVSKLNKKPTDDPHFQFTEKRGSYHKRYAYVTDHGATSALGNSGDSTWDSGESDQGDTYYFKMGTDYSSAGNRQNVYGQSNNDISVGDSNTKPEFFMEGQLVKINTHTAGESPGSGGGEVDNYAIVKVESVADSGSEFVVLKTSVIKAPFSSAASVEIASFDTDTPKGTTIQDYDKSIASQLEQQRCYVVGNANKEGSGFPETWKDQPYSLKTGATQIWKTTMAMSNTARATVLRYEGNEWARIWKEKLIEHKWDIEADLLFGTQYIDTNNGIQYTQGAVDYVLTNGNIFTLTTATKTADDFLDDMSNYLDPRYNGSSANVFFCDTETYNWLHKLGGYFKNNMEVSSNFSADLAVTGRKKVLGLDTTTISTVYGDMNVVRNVHLDGSPVKILAMNMKNCFYRPLVGNGINRDTGIYVGVQTLENSGIDRRVDQILTEAGMEFGMAESHAIWK